MNALAFLLIIIFYLLGISLNVSQGSLIRKNHNNIDVSDCKNHDHDHIHHTAEKRETQRNSTQLETADRTIFMRTKTVIECPEGWRKDRRGKCRRIVST